MWVPPFVFIGPQAPLPGGGQRSGLVGTPPEVGVRTGPQASSTEVQHGWLRLDPAPHMLLVLWGWGSQQSTWETSGLTVEGEKPQASFL